MADSMPVLLALELLGDSEIKVDEFFDDSDDAIHLSVVCCCVRRHLNRVSKFFEITVASYFPDEFKSHFRMRWQTFELFPQEIMVTTGRIPIGNSSERVPIPPAQILAFLWSTANEKPTRAVADRFNIKLRSVNRVLRRMTQAAIDLSGRYIRRPNGELCLV